MQEIIKLAREMGKAIQDSKMYSDLVAAREACDNDKPLQEMIEGFEVMGQKMEAMAADENTKEEEAEALNAEMMDAYDKIMNNINMVRFYAIKNVVDQTMNNVVAILSASLDGEDPMTYDPAHEHEHSCGGDCCGCHGCH